MRKIREVLRLKAAGVSDRKIAAGSARSTVEECLRRANEAGLVWPLAEELDEHALQARLYRREVPLTRRPAPDFAQMHAELARRGVTRLPDSPYVFVTERRAPMTDSNVMLAPAVNCTPVAGLNYTLRRRVSERCKAVFRRS